MVTVSTYIQTVRNTKAIGKKTNKMAEELKHGQMTHAMKVSTSKAGNQDTEPLNGQMVLCIQAIFLKIILMVMV